MLLPPLTDMRIFSLLVFPVLSMGVFGMEMGKDEYCFDAVYEAYGELTFIGNSAYEYWNSTCQNPLKLTSIYASGKTYCTEHEVESGTALLAFYCSEYGELELIPMVKFEENLTAESIKAMRVIDFNEIPGTENITAPVLLSQKYFDASYRTVVTLEFEDWSHHTYGFAMYGFWGSIIVLAMICNACNSFWHHRTSRLVSDIEGSRASTEHAQTSLLIQATLWFKMNFIIPSLYGTKHRQLYYSFTVPTRAEAIIVGLFWIISIILCAVNIRTFKGNLYWPTIPPQVWRYLADRTGIMCYSNLPLIWMFSGRNNVFIWATGWNYNTFNVFHRHIARVATLEAIIHSISYTVQYKSAGYYQEELVEAWFILGITAIVAMSSLLIFSSIWMRKKFYETFLLVHIILSVVVIVSLFYHTSVFEGEFDPYLWPLVAIWSFDRLLRLVRLAWCNLRLTLSTNMIGTSTAVTTYDKDADVIKISVTPAHSLLRPGPGQYFYIYSPLTWKGWENHPFTLGSYGRPGQVNSVKSHQSSLEMNKEIAIKEIANPDSSRSSCADIDKLETQEQSLVFWLRPFDGWTRGLRDICLKNELGVARSRIMIEGPYGHAAHLHNYEHVVFIAGGTGISAVVPYVKEHIRRATSARTKGITTSKDSLRTCEIELIWTCRTAAFIHNVCANELRAALSREDISASFFSASAAHAKSLTTKIKNIEDTNDNASVTIDIKQGRPDIAGTILRAARINIAGGSKAGRLAVLVCGPAGMADEARNAVHLAMKEGCQRLEYVEETFGW